jgi:hypothetical protein
MDYLIVRLFYYIAHSSEIAKKKKEKERIPSIFKDESTGSCICLCKLAVAVATYVSICIV